MPKHNKSPPIKLSLEEELITAAKKGLFQRVWRLVRAGANVEARDGTWGATALMWAAENGHYKCLRPLLKGGADIEARDDKEGATALIWAAAMARSNCVCELLGAGADVTAKDNNDMTALDHLKRYQRDTPDSKSGEACLQYMREADAGLFDRPLPIYRNLKFGRPSLN